VKNDLGAVCVAGLAALLLLTNGRSADAERAAPNELTDSEKAAGWRLLFDGKTVAGWRSFRKSTFPEKGWVAEDGCLTRKSGGGDIVTVDKFDQFDLLFEWRIAEGGNSGIKYFVSPERDRPLGHEYQLLDDAKDPNPARGLKWATASFYDVLPVSTNRVLRPAGQFNQSRIVVEGDTVEHWLNGVKVLEYQAGSPEVKAAVARSKFKDVAGFGSRIKGYILLQDHGGEVFFRNLKIRVKSPRE
jgi:hypothetical protein